MNKSKEELRRLKEEHKEKINEYLNELLYLKRNIYSKDNMKYEYTYGAKIDYYESEMEDIISDINKNVINLYKYINIDFEEVLENIEKSKDSYSVIKFFSKIEIDPQSQTVLNLDEGIKKSVFSNYYEKKEKNDKLINNKEKSNYSNMLNYLSEYVKYNYEIYIYFYDKKYGKGELINKIISKLNYKSKNKYIVLAKNTINIEEIVVRLLKIKGKNAKNNGFYNLNELAKEYYNNKKMMNLLMNINYILYEKHGFDIRNKVFHGTFFNINIDLEIMFTFVALACIENVLRMECEEIGNIKDNNKN